MKRIIKILGSAILLWAVFRVVDGRHVASTLAHLDRSFLLLALFFQLASTLTAASRWSLVMTGLEFHERSLFYVQSYFKGAFFNQALPGSIGGDAVKLIEVSRRGYLKSDSFYGIAIDRLLGIFGLLLMNLVATLACPGILPPWLTRLTLALSGAGLLSLCGLALADRVPIFTRLPAASFILGFSGRIRRLFRRDGSGGLQLFLSVGVHLFSVLAVYALARAVGLVFSPLLLMVAVPPALLLSIIPISLAGWGVREGAMVGIFHLIGGGNAGVLSVSILYGLLLIMASLPGLVLWLRSSDPLC